ncbi:MAG: IS1634 family transposase, partial [Acidobacteriota bacterium]|nr:IS1634 family transposase [Acidobacteriota bacterium]MDE2926623.1 IS1634 family transposase [Acidobacteriota bacterium]
MSLFDEINLVEIRSDAYPDERLMVCRNPLLARQRTRKRQEMLSKTEELLDEIVAATRRDRRPYRGRERIALRVGKVVKKYKMAKHFELDITEESFTYERNTESIAAEAALDGLYVIRTSLPAKEMGAEATVRAYKGLSVVEQAFRSYKTVDLKVRPIYHWSNDRVR